MDNDRRRQIPSVDRVLHALGSDSQLPFAADAVRTVLDRVRAGDDEIEGFEAIVAASRAGIASLARPPLRRVINATGVLLQTNLGRAPLSERAIAAMAEVARGYSNLEYDLDAGERGSRHDHLRALIRRTTGGEDGIVVNNNAAALFMVLQVFAAGREVLVSRGQAVEIGGGFRIPDVLRQSGAQLVEVGTTNRTYPRDYATAWSADTAAILRVHASNFRVVGFTAEPSIAELAAVARDHGGLLFDDLGSGCLVDTTAYGIAPEPTVQESLAAGADLALFSGDKLLGGPQCGIIAGRSNLVAKLRAHPLARALRVDKLTIAALQATLASYAEGRERDEVPLWHMTGAPLEAVRRRARQWSRAWGQPSELVTAQTMVGGGALPGEGVPTVCVALAHRRGPDWLVARLREGDPPIVGRITGDRVLLDPRTVDPADDRNVAARLRGLSAEE